MPTGRIHLIVWLAFAIVLAAAASAQADIYMYVDANGVRHFSNIPTSRRFHVFMTTHRPESSSIYSARRYDKLIMAAAQRHRLSAPLIKAIIKAESNFNPRAVSRKGAKGLMQIMPDNFDRLNISNPFDPRENIMGGARYLRQMLTRFNDNIDLALAAYNAGPTVVEQTNRIPPFKETRDYVRRVKRYYEDFKSG